MFAIMYWTVLKRKEIDRIAMFSTQRELHTEREIRQSQTRLVSMLSHELKTPLFSIRTAIKRGNRSQDTIEQAVHDMSLVLERTALMNEMEDDRILRRMDYVDLAQVVIELGLRLPRFGGRFVGLRADTGSLEVWLFHASREPVCAPGWPAAARKTKTLIPWVAISETWYERR
jgi:signal transduction histidine kinase